MADDHSNGTNREGNNGNASQTTHEFGDQGALANLLTNILGKQQETQQRQMDILERVMKTTTTVAVLGNFKNSNHHHSLEQQIHWKQKTG